MLPNIRTVRVIPGTKFVPVARCPPRFSEDDWDYNNHVKFRVMRDNEKLSERVVADTQRAIEEADDATKGWQKEIEYHIKERASEIRFLIDELNRQKKTAMLEDESLSLYRSRLLKAIEFLKDKSISICKQCLMMRENRISVDLCDDEADRALRNEMKIILGCQSLVNTALKECEKQLVKLREATYKLDEDLYSKDKSLAIDEGNLQLKEYQHDLGEGKDLTRNECKYSLQEWKDETYLNLEGNAKALVSAAQIRAYIDLLLQQVCEDLRSQTARTNEAFARRIAGTKHVKHCLEQKHKDTMDHIHQVQRSVGELEKAMTSKRRAITLCKTRLSNRADRPGIEQTCDTVQDSLNAELQAYKKAVCLLNSKINENNAVLRYLKRVQIMQEEELNIKANTIKIDEVDCMTLREALVYTTF